MNAINKNLSGDSDLIQPLADPITLESDIIVAPRLTITTPPGAIAHVGVAAPIAGVGVTDADPAATVTVTATSTDGDLSLDGDPGLGTLYTIANGTLTVSGSVDAVNALLADLTDTVSGSDSITLGAVDSNDFIANQQQIAVTALPLPVIIAPLAVVGSADQPSPIPNVSISEPGATPDETFNVTLAAASGQLTLSGLTGPDPSITNGTVSVSGALDYVNAVLGSLTDTSAAPDTISITATDSIGGVATQDQVSELIGSSAGTIDTPLPIILPDAHVATGGGPDDTVPLTIANIGSTQALSAFVSGVSGDGYGAGAISGLPVGATDATDIVAGVNNLTAGAKQGDVTIGFNLGGVASGEDLVQNGGFESGTLDWTTENPVELGNAEGIPAHSGSHYLSLAAVGSDAFTTQTLATQPGVEYAISLWYYGSGQYPDDLNVLFGGTNVLSLSNAPAAGWTEYTEYADATSASTVLSIGGRNDPAADGVDDVSVVPITDLGTVLPSETVPVQGNVYRLASPSITGPTGLYLHVGDGGGDVTEPLSVTNAAVADGFSENLDATVIGFFTSGGVGVDTLDSVVSGGSETFASDGAGASGSVFGLAPGAEDDLDLAVSIPTETAETFVGTVTIAAVSDGNGIDTLGTTALGNEFVPVNVTINNYASAEIQQTSLGGLFGGGVLTQVGNQYTLDLGLIAAGAGDVVSGLNLANTAVGPADTLDAVVSRTGAAAYLDTLVNSGTVSVTAGRSLTFDTIDLGAGTVGVMSETLTVQETDTNPGGFSQVLPTQTVVVIGTVVPNTTLANPVINNGPTIVLPSVHVGAVDQTPLSITNDTTANATLVAAVGLLTGAATGSGYIGALQPGANDDTGVVVGINTSAGGVRTGTVQMQFVSTGSFISNVGTNIVLNGGFEDGTEFWTSANAAEASGYAGIPAHTGSEFLALGAVGGDQHTDQTLLTQPGVEYQISLWYWSSGRYPSDLNVSFGGDKIVSLTDAPAAGWTQYTEDAVATSSSTVLDIGGRNDPSWDGVDDVSVIAVGTNALGSIELPQQNVTVLGTVYREASPSFSSSEVYLHVGDGGGHVQEALTVTNDAAADGFSENLNAGVVGFSTGVITAVGSVTGIAPGTTNDTAFTETVFTTRAGYFTNYVSVHAISDGTGIDSFGTTDLGTIDVPVYASILNYATAAIVQQGSIGTLTNSGTNYTLDLGDISLNSGMVVATLGLANIASIAADYLSGSVTASGDPEFSLSGATFFSDIGAGSTASGLNIAINTDSAGVFSEVLVLSPTDSNPGGFSEALPSETVTVTGTVEVFSASPRVNTPSPVEFGVLRAGTPLSQALSVSNVAPAGAYSLSVNAAASGDATVTGSISDLAAGAAADTTDIVAGLSDIGSGFDQGTVTLSFLSQTAGGTLAPITPPSAQVVLDATVYGEAQHVVSQGALPVLHTGDGGGSVSGSITVTNDAFSPYTEALIANFATSTGTITVTPTVTPDIGAYDSRTVTYTVPTDQSGTVTGTVTVDFASDGTGTDGAPVTQIGSQVVTLAAVVFNYATAEVDAVNGPGTLTGGDGVYTLNLGTLDQGDLPVLEDLALRNAAEPASDLLSGTVTASGDPNIGFGGPYVFSGIGAQQQVDGIDLSLDTSATGVFHSTVTILAVDSNPGGYIAPAQTLTVQVTGTVDPRTGFEAIEPGPTVLHVGDSGAGQIGLIDTFQSGSGENLVTTVLTTPGGVTTSPPPASIAPGATGELDYTIDTSNPGTVYGAIGLGFAAQSTGSTEALGTLDVPIVASIYNYATAHVLASGFNVTSDGTGTVINLGTLDQGDPEVTADLAILNAGSGLADRLSGTLTPETNTGLIISGNGAFSQLRGGYADYVQTVGIIPDTAGTIDATFDLSSSGSDPSGFEGALADQTVTVVATVLRAQPPEITAEPTITVSRGAPSGIPISLSDPDAYAGEQFTVDVSDNYGTLSATGTGVTGSGGTSLTITGSLTDVNNALASLDDADANTASGDTITITASDAFGNTSTATTDISVAPLPPSLIVAQSLTLTPGTTTFLGVSLAEPGDFIGNNVTATISDSYGQLTMSAPDGGTITSEPDPTLTIVGTSQQVAAALQTLAANLPNSTPFDNINITVSDGHGNTASASIPVTSGSNSSGSGGVAPSLFYAILAMDAYYRTAGGTLNSTMGDPGGSGMSLGGANFLQSAQDSGSGFFGASWSYTGKTVIAYRGTDELVDVIAWQQFLGSPYSTQGQEAMLFYASNNGGSIAYNPNIVLTGHSLGGGLAGFVSGNTGAAAVPEDAIGYARALLNEYAINYAAYLQQYASWLITHLITGAPAPVAPTVPTLSAQNGTNLLGEVATATRVPFLDNSTSISSHGGLNNPITLHSAALLAIYTYAQNDSTWNPFGTYLFNGLTNSDVSNALGASAYAVMDAQIAYSALQSGGTPFGTTGIAAVFHDADQIATFDQNPLTSAVSASNIQNDLANIEVEYAGWLAKNADTDSSNTGVMTFDQSILRVDLTDDSWAVDGQSKPGTIVGVDDIVQNIFPDAETNGDTDPDNIYLGSNNTFLNLDLSSDDGLDLIYAADGQVDLTAGSGTTYLVAGAGTNQATIDQDGEEFYYIGGTGTGTVDASGLPTDETISVKDNGGTLTTEMGAQEDLLLANPQQFSDYAGTIDGLVIGNDIDLANTSVSQATWQNGALQAGSLSLQLTGADYSQDLFDTETDGMGGTYIRIATMTITPTDPTFMSGAGPEQFTIQRYGDDSGSDTVYLSTEDPGDQNDGDFDPLNFVPVTYQAGSDTANFTLVIDGGDTSGQTKTFGLEATDTADDSGNILATDNFSVISPPPPPPPPGPPNGGGYGCPHFTTFDNLSFWFQGAGEFVAAKSTQPGNNFQVQMRIEPEGAEDSSVSIITQIAVQVGADRVTFDPNRSLDNGFGSANPVFNPGDSQIVWVDGAPITIDAANPVYTLPGGTITEVSENDYRVVLNTGEVVTINPYGDGMGLDIALGANDRPGSVEGFLGSDEGQRNSFMLPDGTVLGPNLTQDELYNEFANAYRVTDASSLFDYAPGQDTETFTNTQYPRQVLTLADFPTDLVAAAAALVAAAGITDPSLAQAAEFDYITMGDPGFIAEDALVAGEMPGYLPPPTPAVISEPVIPAPSIGVAAESSSMVEATGTTSVSFDINLTGPTTADTVVEWGVIPGTGLATGRTYFGAADFGGILPSGTVTISAGATLALVTVDLPAGAVGTEVDKWLAISVDSPTGNPVYDPTAQTDIVNNTPVPGPPVSVALSLLGGATVEPTEFQPALTGSGNSFTLNLGQILRGAAVTPIGFAIANSATAPADSLNGTLTVTSGNGFFFYNTSLPGTIAAGSAYQRPQISPDVTQLGSNTETETLTSFDVNQSGYRGSLPDITLTVEDTIVAPAAPVLNTTSLVFTNTRVGTDDNQAISVSNAAGPSGAPLDVTLTATGAVVVAGTVSGLAPGSTDATDLSGGLDTTHAGVRSGTITVNYFSDLGNGETIPALPNGALAVIGTVYREASAAAALAHPIVHVGDTAGDPLVISNTATADGFSESLITALIGSSGAITAGASGPTGDIVAGGTDSSLGVTLDTSQARIITGQVTLSVTSDGTGIDGLGTISEAAQTLTLTGTVQNYATAQIVDLTQGGPAAIQNGSSVAIDLGLVATGSTPESITLGVSNTATGPADALDGSFSALSASGFSLSSDSVAFLNVGAGAHFAGPEVTLNTGTAGVFTQTLTLDAAGTNASGYDGALATEVVTITGTVGAPAQVTLNTPGPIVLPNQRVGGTPATSALSFTNSASAPADGLDVSIVGTTGPLFAAGAISDLAAGGTDATSITVGVSTGAAGLTSGSVSLDEYSAGTPPALINSATVAVSGSVYRLAAPAVTGPADTIVHRGDDVSLPVTVANTAAADGYSEDLIARLLGLSGGLTLDSSGPTGDIASGGTDASSLNVGLVTSAAGAVSGLVTLDLVSDGSPVDGLGTVDLGQQTITVSDTVDNYATAQVVEVAGAPALIQNGASYTLDFGAVALGSSPQAVTLGVSNPATGTADALTGDFAAAVQQGFSLSSLPDAFSGIAAGTSFTGPSVTLNTGTAGVFSQTITLDSSGTNASGFLGALAPEVVTITGTVVSTGINPAVATLNTPGPITLPDQRVGPSPERVPLSFSNSATPPAEALDVGLSSTTGSATETGSISLLPAGHTDASTITVGVDTSAAGARGGTVVLTESTDGSGTDGNPAASIGSATVTVSGNVYREAAPSLTAPAAFTTRVGGTPALSIGVANTAAADIYSEQLIANFVSASAGVNLESAAATGDINAGGSASIAVGVDTGQAGTVAGSVTLDLISDGTNVDTLGTVDLGQQTVAVTGTVYREAAPSLSAPTAFKTRMGGTPALSIGVANTAAADGYSEQLIANLVSLTGRVDFAAPLPTGDINAGGATTFAVGVNTSQAGTVGGTVTLDLVSDGTNVDNLGTVDLGDQPVAVTGTVYREAAGSLTAPVAFKTRVGGTPALSITVANTAAADGYSEQLIANLVSLTGGVDLTSPLPTGDINAGGSTSIAVGVATGQAGTVAGTVTLDLISDGTNVDNLGTVDLGDQSVAVTGTVYREAAPALTAPAAFFIHAGQTAAVSIGVANTAAADGFSEDLIGDVVSGSASAGVTPAAATTGDIAAGSAGAIGLSVEQATAGVFAGSVGLDLISDGQPIDGLGTVDLGSQTVAVTGTVYNYATAAVADVGTEGVFGGSGTSYTLDLGTVTQGAARAVASLALENLATGLADTLTGSVAATGQTSGFIDNGFGGIGTIAAGSQSSPLSISLITGNAGTFSETLTVTPDSTDAGGSTALSPITITVTGTVAAPAGQVFTLTTGPDTVNGNSAANEVLATGGALSTGDVINAGPNPGNTLILQGAGIFDLTKPTTITGIPTIEAQEGQPSAIVNGVGYGSQVQTVNLRAGMNGVTLLVSPGTPNPGNPSASTITINGAANNDVIRLGTGADQVTMGQGETLYGGSGNDTIFVTAATISDQIDGGTGSSKLWFTGGGAITLGSNVTDIATVYLGAATGGWNLTANAISGLVVQDASTASTDTLTAGGNNQTLTGGGAGKLTMIGATTASSDTTFKDSAAAFNNDTIQNFMVGDLIDITGLGFTAQGTGAGQTSLGLSNGKLTVSVGGVQKTAITLPGSYNLNNFTLNSDGGTGTSIGYHA